ncbi:MAG: EAL domain-containing protein, partial [Rhodospirillales bacterium]|nr:EAL domain-containing protein [Rhodospirillales bacterium]
NIVYYNNSIKEELIRSTQIVSWLHSAIDNNVFKLFFQPQINLRTNTIVGCEALIRWPISTDEWISPGEFIPIAEKAGLIGEITKWTVDEACRTASSWVNEQGLKIRVGVNISAEELASPDFLDYVVKFIEKTKLPPESLEIEITETALMKDADVASRNLKKLRNLGASVAIDDFGTGQASLAYLKNFPIDRLKIDQSFVKGALANKTDREIIVSVIRLAHSLGMDVIAEGAEEKEHIDLLVSLGCDEVQGYFIAKPMPADQFVEFVHAYS